MDITSLRSRIEYLIHMDSEVLIQDILNSGFSCVRCGWCCRENFDIRITHDILRPSNAISIFPDDIRRIIKGTGMQWDEISQPDIYSCLSDGDSIWVTGWILRRNDAGDCLFYRDSACTIYRWRPMICRCYPFFMGDKSVDIMHCEGLGSKITKESAAELGRILKQYEIMKLQSYTHIIEQIGDKLKFANLRMLPRDYSGEVLVCDGEAILLRRFNKN
ncbi:putative Fe-S oxidoreductase [Candidatus Methanoperedens nitroreducens]|uniref:Putative Fe-S oxidoreductase n=1 Tax=Candidatus Methanoperedens nitratireducens TaxID=1392998 RepID=A0A062V252_9EURY|nr:YkgJ family cysteine cluster protein [Candidatus Methanoperedens nitroreducens]KCZ73191.1 putative Fe-S oxidoreductase [Candidatus Methanoperedens nitroreducens]MDJ1422860.1 YkgJ family cysteine cluster protein [Candidatus Methanoperedens sp.]